MLDSHLTKFIPRFKGKKILIIGDIMLDEHIWSKVSRISPEAPVVVADVQKISHVPGGSGNVAANIKTLGGVPLLFGIIGHDSSGEKLIKALKDMGIETKFILRDKNRPTILKSRIIAGSQQVVRVDREDRSTISEETSSVFLQNVLKQISSSDAVIISDYGKGITTPKTCQAVIGLCRKLKKPVLIDPKGSDYKKYFGATIITPNLLEAEKATGIKIHDEKTLKKAGENLLKTIKSSYVLITKSEAGMSLFQKNGKTIDISGIKREVFDITGAGDSVISTLALSLSCGVGIKDACELSNLAGSIKVTKIATQPVGHEELTSALQEKEPASHKIKTRKEIEEISKKLKEDGEKIIFTNGCFDVLHLGHVRYLKDAKKLGDILIVGLNSDSSVRTLKGSPRPYVEQDERAEIIASLESVDYVVVFDETRPHNLIRAVKPDVHVKGGDYKIKDLPEKSVVEELGGKIIVIPLTEGKSTTGLIEKILRGKTK